MGCHDQAGELTVHDWSEDYPNGPVLVDTSCRYISLCMYIVSYWYVRINGVVCIWRCDTLRTEASCDAEK